MLPATSPQLTPHELLRLVIHSRRKLLVCTLIGASLGLAYACIHSDKWEAVQALIVRNEAYNNLEGPGKFRHTDDMKITQETVLELAKSRSVLGRALTDVGPPSGGDITTWPTDDAIAELRKHIKVTPPKGAEFGKTEVFYLKVTDHDRQRAVALAGSICDALQIRFQEVLTRKAESMVKELLDSVGQSQKQVDVASERLAAMEREVGSDLVELRILHSSPSGASDLRQKVVFIEGEIRRLQTLKRTDQELLKLLLSAQQDPNRLLAAPNSLLESQPALKRLKEGLIDAQIKTAQLQGNMTPKHPVVIAAMAAQQEIRTDIHNEINLAIRGIEADSKLVAGQLQTLQSQLDETNNRLAKIAKLRTPYSNLVSEVEHANKLLQTAEANLADARAKQTGALHASLINRIDAPDAGIRPLGPGSLTIVLGGALGGLLTGLGLIALSLAPPLWPSEKAPEPAAIAQPLGIQQDSIPPAPVEPVRPPQAAPQPQSQPQPQPQTRPAATPRPAPSARPRQRRATKPAEKLSLKQALLRVAPPDESALPAGTRN